MFLHSTKQRPISHVLNTKLHMHETHAPTPSPLPTPSQLTTAHETQLRIAINLEIPPELTPTNLPDKLHYHRFENRLLASIRNRSRPLVITVLDAADSTTSDSSVTPSSQPNPIMLDAPAQLLDSPALTFSMLDMPDLRLFSNCIGISRCAPNYSSRKNY